MTRVFVTGHTGFKGSWFSACAARSGSDVFGYALAPITGGFYEQANVADLCARSTIADIRDCATLDAAVQSAQPDILVHMAAQPLVRESYANPRETFDVNVMGTLNVLEAARKHGVKRVLVITSDKVYRNTGSTKGYAEDAPLGGHDPYSASKAMAEILTESWALSYPSPTQGLATTRGGNVIGGGDRSPDRLLPDLFAALARDESITLRYPEAVRPWQHVLDVTSGYMAILRQMVPGEPFTSWNIGPDPEERVDVRSVVEIAIDQWGQGSINVSPSEHPHEAGMLVIDPSKANIELGWHSELSVQEAVRWTVDWERAAVDGATAWDAALTQITEYERRLSDRGVPGSLSLSN